MLMFGPLWDSPVRTFLFSIACNLTDLPSLICPDLVTQIRHNMARDHPTSLDGLSALYVFSSTPLPPPPPSSTTAAGGGLLAQDASGNSNHLELRSDPPQFIYSTAPLTLPDGRPVKPPTPGAGGYSLALNDEQVGRQC
jgi:hypothetical protein